MSHLHPRQHPPRRRQTTPNDTLFVGGLPEEVRDDPKTAMLALGFDHALVDTITTHRQSKGGAVFLVFQTTEAATAFHAVKGRHLRRTDPYSIDYARSTPSPARQQARRDDLVARFQTIRGSSTTPVPPPPHPRRSNKRTNRDSPTRLNDSMEEAEAPPTSRSRPHTPAPGEQPEGGNNL